MQLSAVVKADLLAKRFINLLDFSESSMERKMTKMTTTDFLYFAEKISIELALISSLTTGKKRIYSKDSLNASFEILDIVNSLYDREATNNELVNAVQNKIQLIADSLVVIDGDDAEFSYFVKNEKFVFNTKQFEDIAKKISFSSDRKIVHLFQNELNGGNVLSNISSFIRTENPDINVRAYGVDKDIQKGLQSREKGLITARDGLSAVSKLWADITFIATEKFSLLEETTNDLFLPEYQNLWSRNILKKNGIFVFNIPHYLIKKIENTLLSYEMLGIFRTDDTAGNLIIVLKNKMNYLKKDPSIIKKALFDHTSFPHISEVTSIICETEEGEDPKVFQPYFFDYDDIQFAFEGQAESSEFIIDKFDLSAYSFDSGRALQEPKLGHIPTLATSGIISGRYIDEVLERRFNKKIGFDNLIETKIVKREIEDEEEVLVNGELVRQISMKKSNIIVSTALTPEGEFVELFNNKEEKK
jgi:hypothetical protein